MAAPHRRPRNHVARIAQERDCIPAIDDWRVIYGFTWALPIYKAADLYPFVTFMERISYWIEWGSTWNESTIMPWTFNWLRWLHLQFELTPRPKYMKSHETEECCSITWAVRVDHQCIMFTYAPKTVTCPIYNSTNCRPTVRLYFFYRKYLYR